MSGEAKRVGAYQVKVAWLWGLAIAFVASSVGAQSPATTRASRLRFGDAGEWVMLGSSNALLVSNETFTNSDAKFFDSQLDVGIDRFIVQGVSIGFDVGADYFDRRSYGATTLDETKRRSFGAGVRFGFNLPLGHAFSWYPRLTLGISSAHSHTTPVSSANAAPLPPSSSESSIGPWLNLYAPFLIHPAPHFVVGFGPRWEHEFGVRRGGPYNGSQSNLIGAAFVVGGWWGGPDSDGRLAPGEQEPPFGAKGHVVLTDATEVSGYFASYSKGKGSETSFSFEPGADYFVVQDVSVGVDVFVSRQVGTSLDATGVVTHGNSTAIGVAPRIGELVELTQLVSCWPQVALGYGFGEGSASSKNGVNQHTTKRSWLKLSLPFLVHAASHFFVGAGPYFLHELSDQDQRGYENDATSAGISLLLGGWL